MSDPTVTIAPTLQASLDKANPNRIPNDLQRIHLGTMLTPLKRTFSSLTSSATQDLTAIDASGETTGPSNPNRLPALAISTLRVTTGVAAAGARQVTDVGGTPGTTLATISDDGKTLTFETTVTGFVIEYIPRSYTAMSTAPDNT